MTITEEVRHKISETFREQFGDEVANCVMAMLPPVGWADVATKHDLAALEERIDLRFAAQDKRIDLRFALVDQRIELLEARVGERLEKALRVQSARFMTAMATMFMAFGVIDRLVLR